MNLLSLSCLEYPYGLWTIGQIIIVNINKRLKKIKPSIFLESSSKTTAVLVTIASMVVNGDARPVIS